MGLFMEGFVSEKNFEFNSLWNGEPMEVLDNRGDVVAGTGVGEQMIADFWMNWLLFRIYCG